MKPGDLKSLIKYRNRFNVTEEYYSYPHWASRTIEGVEFLAVVKQEPTQSLTQTIHFIRKDSLEKIK